MLGADTIVAIGGRVLGKPNDEKRAFEMLRLLSGRTHKVYTAVWVCGGKVDGGFTDCARVEFTPLSRRR